MKTKVKLTGDVSEVGKRTLSIKYFLLSPSGGKSVLMAVDGSGWLIVLMCVDKLDLMYQFSD